MSPKSVAIVVHILSKSAMANLIIYSSSVLLENYPASMLSYFLFGFLSLEIITTLIVGPYLSKDIRRSTQSVLLVIIAAIFVFLIIAQYRFYYTLFFFAIFFAVVEVVLSLTSWNSVRSALDILEFKRISPVLPIAGNLTEGIAGFINVGLIAWFGIGYLPYVIMVSLFAYLYFIKKLSPVTKPVEHHARKVSLPTGYPIAVRLFIYGFTLAIGLAFSEYLFKVVVLEERHNAIGEFISFFVGFFNILSAFIAVLFTKNLAFKSPATLMLILPVYWVSTSVIALLSSNIYTVSILYGGYYLLYYTFTTVGRELMMNALPIRIRDYWQGLLTIFPIELGYLLATVALILMNKIPEQKILLCVIVASCLICLASCFNLKKLYIKGLQKELLATNKILLKEKRQKWALLRTVLAQDNNLSDTPHPNSSDIPLAALTEHTEIRHLHHEVLSGTKAFPQHTESHERIYNTLSVLSRLYECYPINHSVLKKEIKSRLLQNTEQLFYWLSFHNKNLSIRFYLPSILYGDTMTRTKAIELICNGISDNQIKTDILDVFHVKNRKIPSQTAVNWLLEHDDWLNFVRNKATEKSLGAHFETLHLLRSKSAYKYTPGEFLFLVIYYSQLIELKKQNTHTVSSPCSIIVLDGCIWMQKDDLKIHQVAIDGCYYTPMNSCLYNYTIVAAEDTRLLCIPEHVFTTIEKIHPLLMKEYGVVFV